MKQALYPIQGSNVVKKYTLNSASDVSRNGGQISGGVSFNNGVASFDGVDGYIDTQNTFEGIFRDSFSIEMRVSPSDGQPASVEVLTGSTNGTQAINVQLLTTGKLRFYFYANNPFSLDTTDVIFSDGQQGWADITIVADSTISGAGGIKIYVNGVEKASGDTSSIVFSQYINNQPFFIGCHNVNGTDDFHFYGDIDYINIYNKALTASEVSNLYNKRQYKGLVTDGLVGYWDFTRQTAYDFSGNGNDGTLTAGTGGFKKQGLFFDGSATKVVCSNTAIMQNSSFTVCGVFDLTANASQDLFSHAWTLGGVDTGWGVAMSSVENIVFYTGSVKAIEQAFTISGKKHFITAVKDGTSVKLYDGNTQVGATGIGTATLSFSAGGFTIGNSFLRYFTDGVIGGVANYNRALSADEIAQNYQYFKTNFNL